MRELLREDMIPALWIAYALYWAIAALRQSRVKQNESALFRWFYVALAALAFVFLFDRKDTIPALWIVLGFYAVLAILGTKQTKHRESLFTRLPHVVAMIVAFVLLFERRVDFGPLGARFVADSQASAWIGSTLTACGIALAIWARVHLGANWSANVTIRADHSLVRTGPYARLRHPVYSGLLLAIAGTALAQGEWRGLLALTIVLVAFSIKAKREEAFLRGEFGAEFNEHAQHAGFFLPRLTRHRIGR